MSADSASCLAGSTARKCRSCIGPHGFQLARGSGPMSNKERIVAVALRLNKLIFQMPAPYRHHDIIAAVSRAGLPTVGLVAQQGFITNSGRFVDRREGRKIAEEAKQLLKQKDAKGVPYERKHSELFSEDVW